MTTATRTHQTLRATSASLARSTAILDRLETAKETPSASRRRRSLELAAQAGLGPWSVRFRSLTVGTDGQPTHVTVDVPSSTLPLLTYPVEVDLRAATAVCGCVAASFSRPCKHAGSALLYGREVVKAYREAASDLAARLREEGNAAALRPSL